MWDESLIESKVRSDPGKKWVAMPVALLFHLAIVAVIVLLSYWYVEAVPQRQAGIGVFMTSTLPASEPPMLGSHHSAKTNNAVTHNLQPPTVISPALSQNIHQPEISLPGNDMDPNLSDLGPGDPNGVIGGDPSSEGLGPINGGNSNTGDLPVIIKPGISQPVLTNRVEPEYPPLAVKAHIEGVVVVEAIISKTGTVEKLRLLRSAHPLLDEAAMKAVMQWTYRPAMYNNRPIAVYFTVTVHFRLAK